MENDFAKKLQLLNCPADMYERAYKHFASLAVISMSELEKILRLLLTKKIIVPQNGKILVEPADFCVLANGFDVISERIKEMDEIAHELGAYKEKLSRLNSKSAVDNIMAMKGMNEPYKSPEGKYSKVPFSVRRFQSKYGVAQEKAETKLEVSKPKTEVKPEPKPVSPAKPVKQDNPSITKIMTEILQKPQMSPLTDETFEVFERLSDSLRRIIFDTYGIDEVNDNIIENLIKLITSEDLLPKSDSLEMEMIFAAITYNKNVSPEEALKIKNSIKEELQFANGTVELGRAA